MAEMDDSLAPSLDAAISAKANPYDVLRNREFLLYLIGRFVASFGQQMLIVAVGWEIYERTHQALALGMVGLTQMAPMLLFTLPAGHLADNHDRKRIIAWMVLVGALGSFGLGIISFLRAPIFSIYICLFVMGTARTFLWPSSAAFMPQLVSRANFSKAVTWNTGGFHLSSVAGPAAGGALIALTHSAATVYLLNGVCALTCFVLILMLRAKYSAPKKEPMTVRSLIVGFQFVFSNPIILGIITLDLFAVLLGGATALLPIYAKDILHVGPSGLGVYCEWGMFG